MGAGSLALLVEYADQRLEEVDHWVPDPLFLSSSCSLLPGCHKPSSFRVPYPPALLFLPYSYLTMT